MPKLAPGCGLIISFIIVLNHIITFLKAMLKHFSLAGVQKAAACFPETPYQWIDWVQGGSVGQKEGPGVAGVRQKSTASYFCATWGGGLCHLYAPSQCCQRRTLPLVFWYTSSGNTGDNEGPAPHFEPRQPLAEKGVRATSTPRIYYYCCLFPLSLPLQLRTTCSTEKNISQPLRH